MNLLCTIVIVLLSCRLGPIRALKVGEICDFESGDCNWHDPNNVTWVLIKGSQPAGEGINPNYDHTCSEPNAQDGHCGTWMATIPARKFHSTQTFVLINHDPLQGQVGQQYCLSFYYHFIGVQNAVLRVGMNTAKDAFNADILWQRTVPLDNGWRQGQVQLAQPFQRDGYLMFIATLDAASEDNVGIDDVQIRSGPCVRTIDCDFETDTCGWINNGLKRVNGTHGYKDHTLSTTTGHFLLAEYSKELLTLSGTMSVIAQIGESRAYCLKGWYNFEYNRNLDGTDTGSYFELNSTVYGGNDKRITLDSVIKNAWVGEWAMFSFDIVMPTDLSMKTLVMLTVKTVGGAKLLLDDFQLHLGPCQPKGDCNFEADFCGWINHEKNLWIRSSPLSRNTMRGEPPYDVTTLNQFGWYAVLPTRYLQGTRAELRSPPLSKPFRWFSFYYMAHAYRRPGVLMKVMVVDLVSFKVIFTQNIEKESSNWELFKGMVKKAPKLYVIRIVTTDNIRKMLTDITIDEIRFSMTSPQFFQPTEDRPAPWSGKDRAWDCSFNSCRGWQFGPDWVVTSFKATKDKSQAPRIDHTFKMSSMNYLLWEPKVGGDGDEIHHQASTLQTSTNLTASTIYCLSFWYYETAEFPYDLMINLVVDRQKKPLFMHRSSGQVQRWKQLKVPIYSEKSSGYVEFEFKTKNYTTAGTFAIDDLKIRASICDHSDGFTYTFSAIDDLEVAHVQPLGNKLGAIVFPELMPGVGPRADFTTGTGKCFLFRNKGGDASQLYESRLILPDIPPHQYRRVRTQLHATARHCVQFAFQRTGQNTTLKVYYVPFGADHLALPAFVSVAEHSSWAMGHFSYWANYRHKIIFVMSKPYDRDSYVALDDVTLSDRPCSNAWTCDFEDDMCSYYDPYRGLKESGFDRMIGPPRDLSFPGPKFDHTLNSYGGSYIFTKGDKDGINIANMRSPVRRKFNTDKIRKRCLSFYTQLTAPDAMLKLSLFYYFPNSKAHVQQVFSLTNVTENTWTLHTVEIAENAVKDYLEYEIWFTGQTKKADTVVAIDDIEWSEYSCDSDTTFTCRSDKRKISTEKVQNFVADCADGSDEVGHDCNFDKSSKNYWIGRGGSNRGWTQVKVAANAEGNFPKVDGSGSAQGGYMAFLPGKDNRTFYMRDKLVRNMYSDDMYLKRSFHTCMLTFSYVNYRPGTLHTQITVAVGRDYENELTRKVIDSTNDTVAWHNASLHIGAYVGRFSVAFEGYINTRSAVLAIDNIQFVGCGQPPPDTRPCSNNQVLCATTKICILQDDLCDFQNDCGDNWDEGYANCRGVIADNSTKVMPNCDFELSQAFCGFSNDTPKDGYYFRDAHGAQFLIPRPSADHTTRDVEGQFVCLSYNGRGTTGRAANLYTPMMSSKGGACAMHFFYNIIHMDKAVGMEPPRLQVYARYADGQQSARLFLHHGPNFDWVKGMAKLESSEPFQFVFEGYQSNAYGSISLDDVSYTPHCVPSKAAYKPGHKKSKSAALSVILSLLGLCVLAALGFVLYRRAKEGRLVMPTLSTTTTRTGNANLVSKADEPE